LNEVTWLGILNYSSTYLKKANTHSQMFHFRKCPISSQGLLNTFGQYAKKKPLGCQFFQQTLLLSATAKTRSKKNILEKHVKSKLKRFCFEVVLSF